MQIIGIVTESAEHIAIPTVEADMPAGVVNRYAIYT